MTNYPFLIDLCESHLIPSRNSLKGWKPTKLRDLCYLYFLGLRILLSDPGTKDWARRYCASAGDSNDFSKWRTSGNDLYAMLHALTADDQAADKFDISPSVVRQWLRHVAVHDPKEGDTRRLFMRLDGMFHVENSAMRAMRRTILDWDDVDDRDRDDVLTKLIQMIHNLAPSNSELLPELKKMSMTESASGGATGSANVATVVGGLGAGFDPDGNWRSVFSKKKPVVVRR